MKQPTIHAKRPRAKVKNWGGGGTKALLAPLGSFALVVLHHIVLLLRL